MFRNNWVSVLYNVNYKMLILYIETCHCIIVTFNIAAGYDKNKKGIEPKMQKVKSFN